MNEHVFMERVKNLKKSWFYSIFQKTVINHFHFCYYIDSHLNFILDIRLNRFLDLMNSVIKHVITVGLGKIKTNNKGKELNSLIIHDKTFRYNKDKPLTQTFKSTLSKIERSKKYRAAKILNQASDGNK